jgi:hypothetical protein
MVRRLLVYEVPSPGFKSDMCRDQPDKKNRRGKLGFGGKTVVKA